MKHFFSTLLFTIIISISAHAQKDTVVVMDTYEAGGVEGTLNTAIQEKIDAGTLSNTVFKLNPYGLYVLSGAITTPAGSILEIVAPPPGNTQLTAPPMIAWTASSAPDKRYNFDIPGDIVLKNVWLLYGGTDGSQAGSTLRVGDSSTVVGGVGGRATFENVIFDRSLCPQNGSGAVEIYSTFFKGLFKNCYFRNNVDPHYRYYGRALSFRYQTTGLHADSVLFENCTFANMGYVYMQEGAEYGDNVHFNHCTFYNIVMFALESGWWYKMSVTNSLFINTYMYGAIPVNDGEGFGGTINITPIDSGASGAGFGFSVPFIEQDRRILFTNSGYFLDQWLIDWMGYGPNGNPQSIYLHSQRRDDEIPVPQPIMNGATIAFFDSVDGSGNKVFPFMNKADIYDGVDPGFKVPPINLDSLKSFLWHKWGDAADVNWAYRPEDDYGQVWPMSEDLSFTNATLKTAGMGGFPLGDLYHWWPAEYTQWKAQEATEKARITNWLETGKDVVDVKEVLGNILPSEYALNQNYPNPFNPATQIEYSIPLLGHVSLKVFNTLGQEVATLYDGVQNTGNYKATFDGTGLTSGIYLYRLQSDNVSITKKFILIK